MIFAADREQSFKCNSLNKKNNKGLAETSISKYHS